MTFSHPALEATHETPTQCVNLLEYKNKCITGSEGEIQEFDIVGCVIIEEMFSCHCSHSSTQTGTVSDMRLKSISFQVKVESVPLRRNLINLWSNLLRKSDYKKLNWKCSLNTDKSFDSSCHKSSHKFLTSMSKSSVNAFIVQRVK